MSTQKAARDLKIGDVINDTFGGAPRINDFRDVRGTVTQRDGHTTPGAVYIWLDGNDDARADLAFNHGDPVKILDDVRPKLEDVIKLARQLKEEWDFDWDGFRADPEAHVARANFIVDGDESRTTAAAIRLLMDVE